MEYKYDTHMHTSEGSACSDSTAAEMAVKYKEEGYTGIFVTDHFFNGNTSVPRDLPWEQRVELYCKGYEHALQKGREIGLDVFFGFEYSHGSSADLLTYGLDGRWLAEHREIMDMSVPEYISFVHDFGGMVIHAHPFRMENYISEFELCPMLEDGVEIVNASNRLKEFNDHAADYAKWYGLPVTAGSDSHNTSNRFYPGGIVTDHKITCPEDYISAVKNRRILRLLDRERN